MKKFFYTLITLALALTTANAQTPAAWMVFTGHLTNTNGASVPVQLSLDSFTTVIATLNTYPDGSFFDSIPMNTTQAVVYSRFYDCNGNAVLGINYYSPANGNIVSYTADYCPNGGTDTTAIVVYGTLTNTNGNPVNVTFITDLYPNGVIAAVSDSFVYTVLVSNINDPITAYFTDCTGATQTVNVGIVWGSTNAAFYANYCPDTTGQNPCGTLFTASYDESTNAFTLMLDSSVTGAFNAYAWNFGDGTTSTELYPTHTYASDGLYNVCFYISGPNGALCSYCHTIGIDANGNPVTRMDAAGFTLNVVPFGTALGVNNLTESTFSVYPNPVGDIASVSLYAASAGTYAVHVFNAAGQQLKAFNVDAQAGQNNLRLPMQDLAKGMYLMTVQFDGKKISRSFVK